MTGAIPGDRDVIDKVDEGNMSTVEDRRTHVVFPSYIRVGDGVEVKTISAIAGCGINGARQSVCNLQLQITRYSAVQFSLQRVVMPVPSVESFLDGTVSLVRNQTIETWGTQRTS